jgi:hypothetical protein
MNERDEKNVETLLGEIVGGDNKEENVGTPSSQKQIHRQIQ